MNDKKSNKALIIKAVSKMVADKELVRLYLKGEVSIEELNKKGIKLARPI